MRKRTFGRIKKEKDNELEVDITSLLDILVILLVFLLKSYNASDLKLEVAKNISLPKSKSSKLGNHAVIVQVSEDRSIWLNNTKIGQYSDVKNDKIDVLYQALKKSKTDEEEKIKALEERSPASEKGSLERRKKMNKRVNIVLDQSLPYQVLRQVMHTSALAGFPEFKFIVQGNF